MKKADEMTQEETTKKLNELKIEVDKGLQKNEHKLEKTDSVSHTITGTEPKERSEKEKAHSQLETLRERSTTCSTSQAASPKELEQEDEISILNKKLGLEFGACRGFKHEVDPTTYVQHSESTSWDSEFSSEEERWESQKNMTLANTSASGYVGARVPNCEFGPGGGGFREKKSGSKSDIQRKTKVAIITRTNFHQVRKFRVKVTLSERAISDAKALLKDTTKVAPFIDEYEGCGYAGNLASGGWFRTVATAESSEDMEFAVLAEEARQELGGNLNLGFASKTVAVGVGLKGSNMNDTSKDSNIQRNYSSVNVSTKKESAPSNTFTAEDLEIKLKNAENWTVLPADELLPIHEIMKIQADDTKDDDLRQAAEVIEEEMSLRMAKLPTGHPDWSYKFKLIILGDSGVGKSSLLSRFQGQGFQKAWISTIGVECKFFSVLAGGTHVNLELRDTAGQESFLAVTRQYYRGCAGAFLVYDVTRRETFDHLDRWLKELRENEDKVDSFLYDLDWC